jgi:antagonist of KipI
MAIRVQDPGLLTTVQDLGRYGYSHLGISSGGAADSLAMRIANLLVGNAENTATLEMTLTGATLEFDEESIVAFTGGECDCRICGEIAPMWQAIRVPAGGILACGAMKTGARLYLAIQGRLDVESIMGSVSTNMAGRFGGLEGRGLRKGDLLGVRKGPNSRVSMLKPGAVDGLYSRGPLRVTRGAQHDWFGPEAFGKLFSYPYAVSEQSNRSGLRLQGESISPRVRSQLLTEGVSLGAIQVPQDDQLILLFVDQQTTGGYPKIANVISADLYRVGQLRPREQVRFIEVRISGAIQLLQEQEEWLKQIFQWQPESLRAETDS